MSASPSTAARPAERSVPAQMADFITAHAASAGGVTRDDLLLDFTGEQIDTHFEAAKQIARRSGKVRH
ncbi:hypothetical protein LJR090_002527 [Bosea sp. LjRoot90]|uniref:hypothetical protein n=1 Tax=Bosea sp. LjRoot90 TaxID=3342342 RepID=UPI003ECD0AE8